MAVREDNLARTLTAFATLGMGMVGIVVISLVAVVSASDKEETSRLVFVSVLPLFGTCVGAILAFYFYRENLQAASKTTLDAVRAVGGFGPDTMIAAVMTRFDGIQPRKEVADDATAKLLPLDELYDVMKTSGRGRVPIFRQQARRLVRAARARHRQVRPGEGDHRSRAHRHRRAALGRSHDRDGDHQLRHLLRWRTLPGAGPVLLGERRSDRDR